MSNKFTTVYTRKDGATHASRTIWLDADLLRKVYARAQEEGVKPSRILSQAVALGFGQLEKGEHRHEP